MPEVTAEQTIPPSLYQTRIPPETARLIAELEAKSHLAPFLHGVAELMEKHILHERYEPVRHSRVSGRVTSCAWRPFGSFNGRIYLHKGFGTTVDPHEKVAIALKHMSHPVVFNHGANVYVVAAFRADWNGRSVEAGVWIQKASVLHGDKATQEVSTS